VLADHLYQLLVWLDALVVAVVVVLGLTALIQTATLEDQLDQPRSAGRIATMIAHYPPSVCVRC